MHKELINSHDVLAAYEKSPLSTGCLFRGIVRDCDKLKPVENVQHFADNTHLPLDKMAAILAEDIFKRISLNEKVQFSTKISLKLVPKGPIDINPALFR